MKNIKDIIDVPSKYMYENDRLLVDWIYN